MRRLLAAGLCLVFAGLCACGQAEVETTTQTITTEAPIQAPISYEGVPEGYWALLNEHRLIMLSAESYIPQYGYAVVDINDDGIPELLLGSADGLNVASPHSVFTLKDDEPVLLTSFWSRSRGTISADGTIYNVGSGGAAYTYLSSYRLEANADTLTLLTSMGSDYSSEDNMPYYVKIVDGKRSFIPQSEFWDYSSMYSDPPNPMKLTVIPITS